MNAFAGEAVTAAAEPVATNVAQPGQTPGDLLRLGREQRGLTVQQIADELHLDVRVVQDIESNNFLALGAPVYARGHLRKYSGLLGIAPELVLSHYELLADVPVVPVVTPTATAAPLPNRGAWRIPLRIVAGLAIAGGLIWLASSLFGTTALRKLETSVSLRTTTPSVQSTPVMPEQPAAAVGMPPTAQPQIAAAPAAVESRQATPAQDAALRLKFTSASWAEIYDAANRRLMYDVGQPGQTRLLTGTAPFRVTLGAASAVVIDINNAPVTIPRRAGKDAARFEIVADGSVR